AAFSHFCVGISRLGLTSEKLHGPPARSPTQLPQAKMTKRSKKPVRRKMKRSIGRALPMKRDGDGRVHLIVRRDASGAPQALELSAPLFAEEWQNSLATSAASTAYGILQGSPTWKRVVELTQK